MANVGAGQLFPTDSNSDYSVAAFIVGQLLSLVDTMKVVQVVAVHPGAGTPPVAGTVDVQILIAQLDGAGNAVPQDVVYGLPYLRLGGGKWAVIVDPAINDIGLAIASDRDISSLKAAAAAGNSLMVNPGSYREYDVSDGVYLGTVLSTPVPAATFWLKPDGTLNITDAKGNVLSTSASGFSLTGNLAVTGSITATANVTAGLGGADQVGLQTHTHPANGSPPTPGT